MPRGLRCFTLLALLATALPSSAQVPSSADVAAARRQQQAVAEAMKAVPVGVQPSALPKDLPGNFGKPAPAARKDSVDDLIARFNSASVKTPKQDADLLIFVSFGMPLHVLQSLSRQAAETGAILVLRGLKDRSLRKTKAAIASLSPSTADWEIHPEAFKQFSIKAVPAFVVADASAGSVMENGCAPPTSFAAVSGEMSVEQALDIIRLRADKPGIVRAAEVRLAKLKASRQ